LFGRYESENKPKSRLISWNISDGTGANFDMQGRMQNWSTEPHLGLRFQRNAFVELGASIGYERLFEQEFGAKRTATHPGEFFGGPERSTYQHSRYLVAGANPSKKYSVFLFLGQSHNSFDFDFGAGEKFPRVSPAALADPNAPLDPGPGTSLDMKVSVSYQPTNELRASLDYTKSRLRRNDTRLLAFDENIYSFKSTYQFTRFIFARARIDYDTLASNVRGQFLFGYTPNPGTAFYLGYNDDMTRNGSNPFTGQLEPGFRRNGRTFFIKMSYLFRRSFGG